MIRSVLSLALVSLVWHPLNVYAQHCAPITESYLSRIEVDRDALSENLELGFTYAKTGGKPMARYQAYVVAYLQRDEARVPGGPDEPLLDPTCTYVVSKVLIERNDRGRYSFSDSFEMTALANELIAAFEIEEEQTVLGGYGSIDPQIRLAVFIPFLEDRTYANLEGLPEDRHECNYFERRALLFQELPYRFSIHFGIVEAVRLEKSRFVIQIHQSEH